MHGAETGGFSAIRVAALGLPALLTVWFASFVPTVAGGGTLGWSIGWLPQLGINLSFHVDGLSLLFLLLIAGIGFIIALYSGTYLAGFKHLDRFFLYLMMFMLAMLGLVAADNLIALFVFWELTTIASYLLIGLNHEEYKSRRNALQALLVTGTGGLAMLAGFLMLGAVMGTFELSEIVARGDELQAHPLFVPILILVLLGAFTKSAQVPFHFWLPNAMAAPTPVSAYLHSATMVKAGVYLLARVHPAMAGNDIWLWSLAILGATTAVLASLLAMKQTDLKQALAYTTLMALGTLTLFLAGDSEIVIVAAISFLIVHALYKCAMFLIVGILDHETGTRDYRDLGGLARALPITTVAAALAGLSMAGFPPFLGYYGKKVQYEGALAIASEPMLIVIAVIAANAMMVAVAGTVALKPFFLKGRALARKPHEAPWTMWIGPVLLAGLGLVLGIAPTLTAGALIEPAVIAVLGREEDVALSLFKGVDTPFLLSLATIAIGVALFLAYRRVQEGLARGFAAQPIQMDPAWDRFLVGMLALAEWQTRVIQGGLLRRYILYTVAVMVLAVGGTLIVKDGLVPIPAIPALPLAEWLVVAGIATGAAVAVFAQTRFLAITALGILGLLVALLFLMYGAPDLAKTQLLVETLVVVIIVLVMLRLPTLKASGPISGAGRLRDGVVAGACGLVTTLLMLGAQAESFDRRLTDYFEATSVPEAFGRNIVNVILVDFRALDTLGEIVVVAVAGLAVFALIKLRPKPDRGA